MKATLLILLIIILIPSPLPVFAENLEPINPNDFLILNYE